MTPIPQPNVLPPKENALFKRIVKCYEHKQYKNALKFAKQILSNPKFAEHGETLAMKGLVLNCMGKAEEAADYVKRGLKNDVRSHVCWHVYGLVQRSEKKYDEAIKAYRNALKIDKDNIQILRDLSLLQLQTRDLEGYKEIRHLLFTLRPTQRLSWVTFAMAHHLLENYDTALTLLEEFRRTQDKPVKTVDQEYSELLLYQNMVYRHAQKYHEALGHLELYNSYILDKVSCLEIKAYLLTTLNRKQDAAEVYRTLLNRNPENKIYYQQLEDCFYTDAASDPKGAITKRIQFYREMRSFYPKALAPQRLPLNFTDGADFREHLLPYAKNLLRKGAPPLFVSLRSLYRNPSKVRLIEETFVNFVDSLELYSRFPNEVQLESPSTLLWTYYYLALHYDHLRLSEKALFYLDKATAHTPTLIELILVRAKVYKHAGDIKEGARLMDEAQGLDTADRYVNSKCAKYMLQAGMIQEAEQVCAKFTREGTGAMDYLNEMQCMWFQTQCAEAYLNLNMLGEALKKCHEIDRHFIDIIEDQFDFHTYCARRMTLCAYYEMLKLEDTLRKHRWYFRAAKVAIIIYLRLYDKPFNETEVINGSHNDVTASSELRKQMRKAKKQMVKNDQALKIQQSVQKAGQEQTHQNASNGKKPQDQETEEPKKVPVLDPKVLIKTVTPLDEALRFLKPLLQLNSEQIESYLLGFEVFFRRKKMLMMLHCLKKAFAIDPLNTKLQECKARFKSYLSNNTCDSSILEITLDEMRDIFESPATTPSSVPH